MMLRKRYIVCVLSFIVLIFGFATNAEAKDALVSVKATVELGADKQLSELTDPVIISNGRVLLPIREIGDYLSLKVFWDQKTKTASLYGVNKKISLTIGSKAAYVNKKKVSLDVAAKVVNGKTYIPLKFVASTMGESVTWNSSQKMLSIPSSYAMGTDDDLTYWIHLKSGGLFQAVGKNTGSRIGGLQIDLSILKNFKVVKLTEKSSYIRINQISGPSGTVNISGQALIINGEVYDQANFSFMGFYPDSNIDKAQGNVLLTDGKKVKFLNNEGVVKASYDLTELMQKDEIYMIEHYSNDFMILREYNSQHLIVYDFKAKKKIYVHQVISLPEYEKEYLVQAGLDRSNEMEYDHIITFDKADQGTLKFKYKSKKMGKVDTYTLKLQ
ncbi:hypothetical protein J2T13_002636 [Paenibacillus sp. DS2015]|uniref:copper amine oxidase N-terminal domain-containing protein n=1 Tax=Paenibacillus sp. DS2015 TaxID=3373917 RepID=UPI003D1C5EC1